MSDHIMEVDPNIKHGLIIPRTMNNTICCYKEMNEEKISKESADTNIPVFCTKKQYQKKYY